MGFGCGFLSCVNLKNWVMCRVRSYVYIVCYPTLQSTLLKSQHLPANHSLFHIHSSQAEATNSLSLIQFNNKPTRDRSIPTSSRKRKPPPSSSPTIYSASLQQQLSALGIHNHILWKHAMIPSLTMCLYMSPKIFHGGLDGA